MKKRVVILASLFLSMVLNSQTLSIEECYKEAQQNYPLQQNEAFLEKSTEYNVSNALKMWLPNLSLNGKATYQSDVTKIPISLPNIDIPELSKDQYNISLEISQTIFDGGSISGKTKILKAQNEVEKNRQAVNMYAINQRVNQVFFGILVLDEQLKQNELLYQDLQNTYDKVNVMVSNGVANEADLDRIEVSQLNTLQQRKKLQQMRLAYIQILGVYINKTLSENTILEQPKQLYINSNLETSRPELLLFKATDNLYSVSQSVLYSDYMPKLSAFVQGGYGKPGLNMLNDDFDFYYMAGVRLSWNIRSIYTNSNDKSLIQNNRNINKMNEQTFLFNNKLEALQGDAEISAIKKQIEDDDKIIALRESILSASEKRTENGTMSIADLITEINYLSLARQNKQTHLIQLLQKEYELKLTLGK